MYNISRKYSVDARPSTTAAYLRQVFKVNYYYYNLTYFLIDSYYSHKLFLIV